MATNAVDVLSNSRTHENLNSAISDCVAAFALSARPREWSTQVLDARAAAARAVALEGDVAFVFGNEGAGLSPDLMAAAHEVVAIPMPGPVDSMNIAAAAAVCLFERVRQQGAATGL